VFVDKVDEDLSRHRLFSVNRSEYEVAVRCLQRTSPMYANVELSAERLATLPEGVDEPAQVLVECCTVNTDMAAIAACLRQEGPADAVWSAEDDESEGEAATGVAPAADIGRDSAGAAAAIAGTPDVVALIGETGEGDEPLRFLRLAEEWRALVAPDHADRSLATQVMERRLQNRLHRGEAISVAASAAPDSGGAAPVPAVQGEATDASAACGEAAESALPAGPDGCAELQGSASAPGAALPLLGKDRALERKAHQHVRLIKELAAGCGRAEYERQLQRSVQAVHPAVLVVPVTGEPLSSFDPRTLPMAAPELFPYGDGAPFLDRRTPMTLQGWARMMLMREARLVLAWLCLVCGGRSVC
jgi:hypothetical protein